MTESRVPAAHGVERLSQMPDCELAEGAPDVRGWELTTPTSAHLGVVKDLLVDLDSMHVRYLDVAFDAGRTPARRVLIPIGKVWINDVLDQVIIADPSDLDALPDYDPGSFGREFEHRVLAAFGDSGGEVDFYTSPAFDGARFHRARRGRVRCERRQTDAAGDACAVDDGEASAAVEAANGVELPVVPDAAAD